MTIERKNRASYSIALAAGPAAESLPIVIHRHPRSRRMVIRYQPLHHQVRLTLPRYVTIKQGLRFVEEKRGWLERQVRRKSAHRPLADGQLIPVLGKRYALRHVGGRGVIRMEEDYILVPGGTEFMSRRVREWLKRLARDKIVRLAREKAEAIGKPVKKITLRDTTSRWGSCSHDGNLSFSWRLVFAPFEVLDYVVCHEVAHLKHHDHSPAFWAAVRTLCPGYLARRQWLRTHGHELYTYGDFP